jgi:hypothetical protein
MQVDPQLIPDGLLVTVPPPVTVTERVAGSANVAVTVWSPLIVTMQLMLVPALLHAPPHPVKSAPLGRVSVTVELLAKLALHDVPQLMPDGELVTMPSPETLTESV